MATVLDLRVITYLILRTLATSAFLQVAQLQTTFPGVSYNRIHELMQENMYYLRLSWSSLAFGGFLSCLSSAHFLLSAV